MNFKQTVPEYLTSKRNTIIQIVFATIFAYAFINIYLPFGAEQWYDVNLLQFRILSGAVVLLGMAVIVVTRMLMFYLKKNHDITLAFYIWMIVTEILLLGLFFTMLEKIVLNDSRNAIQLMVNATQNTVLILLIPYLFSSLFFAWADIRSRFDQVIHQLRDPSEVFVPFKDENGKVRITLKLIDISYLEANDNYVNIVYADQNKLKTYMLRNSIKNLQPDLVKYSILRCHRKYAVNKINVSLLKKGTKGYELVLKQLENTVIPISRTYQKQLMVKLGIEPLAN